VFWVLQVSDWITITFPNYFRALFDDIKAERKDLVSERLITQEAVRFFWRVNCESKKSKRR